MKVINLQQHLNVQQISLSDEVADITYSNNKIVPVKDAGDHIKDPVVKESF